MTAAIQQANKLEQWFSGAPDLVQQVLRPVFDAANDQLKAVAGDPHDLVQAGEYYVQLGRQIVALAEQQHADRQGLASAWEGEAYAAFAAKAHDIEERLREVGEATGKTKEVLHAAAEACVEGANLIIDVIVALIAFAIGTLLVKLALAALTFGASMLAWVAEQIAAGIIALTRIANVTMQVARILTQISQIFEKLATILRGIAQVLALIKDLLVMLDEMTKGAKGLSKLGMFSVRAGAYATTNAGIGATTNLNIPLPGGSVLEAGKTANSAAGRVGETQEAAGQD